MQRGESVFNTLALIKPDIAQDEKAVSHVIRRITGRGYLIKDRVEIKLSNAQARAFYAEHAGKPFFDGLVAFMSSGPLVALLIEGDDVIRGWRTMIGPTSPAAARQLAPQSIRAVLGADGPRNAVHGSDSAESAQRELSFFF
ncbi:nucleoside-diphosphate kinase, partial [Kickxella alabastrina]|uniref:nucleoside-diphosphate kinase n=1 Tax=Kickxella alabastrina TaxID=61397 RepID=UPI00221F63FD